MYLSAYRVDPEAVVADNDGQCHMMIGNVPVHIFDDRRPDQPEGRIKLNTCVCSVWCDNRLNGDGVH